jgi:hypothetical protein
MAWPKRGTRSIVVDGESFLWHYSGHCQFCSDDVITAGKPGAPYVLFVDPLAWAFEFRPSSVAAALRWARAQGWSAENGPTRGVALGEKSEAWEWLPEGKRHLECGRSSTECP